MTSLEWDKVENRYFQAGLDRGVLYPPIGSGIPWNGLTKVEEDLGDESAQGFYIDGVKYMDAQTMSDYTASMNAFTYPDEFLEFEGIQQLGRGLYVDGQSVKQFGLSYRTGIGNAVNPDLGYRIHILYNLTATPDDKEFNTQGGDSDIIEFGWNITALSEPIVGYRPTAHAIIDSRWMTPQLLKELEGILYGDDTQDAQLPPLADLMAMLLEWHLIEIVDNGDGTWTATTQYDDLITMTDPTTFAIDQIDVTYLDADTYVISTTD